LSPSGVCLRGEAEEERVGADDRKKAADDKKSPHLAGLNLGFARSCRVDMNVGGTAVDVAGAELSAVIGVL
jgi:hypothetical protein